MAVEIERKFLLSNSDWKRHSHTNKAIKQGYLSSVADRTVRIRVIGDVGVLTVKGKNVGATRPEFEYEIPIEEAETMLMLCEQPIIEKTRFEVEHNNKTWEIDEFAGVNRGLVVAEIELNSENEAIAHPDWLGKEVTSESKYYNSSLISNPFKDW